jgi:hypothetical protein
MLTLSAAVQQQQQQMAMATSPITAGLDLSFLAGLNPELYHSLGQSLAFLNQGKNSLLKETRLAHYS